jgi:hypothetical protein
MPMDRMLMDIAATNFEAAQALTGPDQTQRMSLGLTQMARALVRGSRDPQLLEIAGTNFESAQEQLGDRQMQLICLGLTQFARGV